MGIGAFGYLIVAFTDQSLTPLFVGPTIGAIGLAFVITLVADLAVGAAPKERAGGAAATSETSSELGGALGLAILGSIGAAIYRGGIPAHAPETIGDAVSTPFAGVAQDAFGSALTVTASISAAALSVTALVAFVLLRRSAAAAPAAAAASEGAC
jgi:DHA2 family multidrug resistance protein-like MFS transporter